MPGSAASSLRVLRAAAPAVVDQSDGGLGIFGYGDLSLSGCSTCPYMMVQIRTRLPMQISPILRTGILANFHMQGLCPYLGVSMVYMASLYSLRLWVKRKLSMGIPALGDTLLGYPC